MSKRARAAKKIDPDFVDGEEFSDGEPEPLPKKKASPKKRAPPKNPRPPQDPFVDDLHWMIVPPSLIWRDFNTSANTRIAAFDLDGTLINTKGGHDFARDENDWAFFSDKVPGVLRDLYQNKGFKIVIFSNQAGIKSALTGKAATTTKNRIMNFIREVGVPMLVFLATNKDGNRKPDVGMWQYFVTHCNGGLPVDPQHSFFCGDAAGRPQDVVGDSDRQYARNVGLAFKVPEEMFGEMKGKRQTGPPDAAAKERAAEGTHPNQALIDTFKALSDHVMANQVEEHDKFRAASYRKVAEALTAATFKVTLTNLELAGQLPNVGKASLAKIKEFLETGTLAEYEAILSGAGGHGGGGAAPNTEAAQLAAAFM